MPTLSGFQITVVKGVLTEPNHGTATLSLSGWSGALNGIGGAQFSGALYTGTYILYAVGHSGDPVNGFVGELSGYSFTARGGGWAIKNLPLPTLSTSGTVTTLGSTSKNLPTPTLLASGVTDAYGRAYLTAPRYSLQARGGGRFAKTLSSPTLTASGLAGKTGSVRAQLPSATLVAHGYGDNLGSATGVLPGLQPAYGATVVVRLPRPLLLAVGTTGAATSYEAYSITFVETRDGPDVAATHYTNYPFTRFVRFEDKYYGVAADGLFELGGDLFDTAPIVSVVETAATDFDIREAKRPISLYIGGEVGADFKVSVKTADVRTDTYNYRPVDKTGIRNYRTLFGKGLRARYVAYRLTNTDGGDFSFDDLTAEIVPLSRSA